MISRATRLSSSTMTCERMALRVSALFFARAKRARSAVRMAGMTSSMMSIVESSRYVPSETPPVFVRVVTPRTTLVWPETVSQTVTPPRMRPSIAASSNSASAPVKPASAAPCSGSAGSVCAASTPHSAAAPAQPPMAVSCPLTVKPGPTSTMRSEFKPAAAPVSCAAVDPAGRPTKPMHSPRCPDAAETRAESSARTVSRPLAQTTYAAFFSAKMRSNAAL